MSITVIPRPYLVTFHLSGIAYPITSEEAQRVIDSYPVVKASRHRVILRGGSAGPSDFTTIRAATIGGGPAFIVNTTTPHVPHTIN